ncbi:uncharacterized protein J3D65DRAFT_28814 [Phyllosticta citribraziliensis]|uniref:Uncharacterized protein n=1 Tax=Phyllosticta citribraziliensis TaxID=989973 RepID=A0ABR1MBH0_9PEZI
MSQRPIAPLLLFKGRVPVQLHAVSPPSAGQVEAFRPLTHPGAMSKCHPPPQLYAHAFPGFDDITASSVTSPAAGVSTCCMPGPRSVSKIISNVNKWPGQPTPESPVHRNTTFNVVSDAVYRLMTNRQSQHQARTPHLDTDANAPYRTYDFCPTKVAAEKLSRDSESEREGKDGQQVTTVPLTPPHSTPPRPPKRERAGQGRAV